MDEIGIKIGVKNSDLSPWYLISYKKLGELKARSIIRYYNDSMYLMLSSIYPNSHWVPWKFKRFPAKISINGNIKEMVLKELEEKFNINSAEDWSRISSEQLNELKFNKIIIQSGGLAEILKELRPDIIVHPSS